MNLIPINTCPSKLISNLATDDGYSLTGVSGLTQAKVLQQRSNPWISQSGQLLVYEVAILVLEKIRLQQELYYINSGRAGIFLLTTSREEILFPGVARNWKAECYL